MAKKLTGLLLILFTILILVGCTTLIDKVDVTFHVDGKTVVTKQKLGAAVDLIADPKVEGKTFLGWFTDAATTRALENDAVVTIDMHIYAKFNKPDEQGEETKEKVTITFSVDNTLSNLTLNKGSVIVFIKDPIKEDHDFDGWFYDEEFTQLAKSTDTVDSDITLYAKFSKTPVNPNLKTVDFEPIGKDNVLSQRKARIMYQDTIPYMGLKEFLKLIEGVIDYNTKTQPKNVVIDEKEYVRYKYIDYIEDSNGAILKSVVEYYYNGVLLEEDIESYSMFLNHQLDKVEVSSYDFFSSIENQDDQASSDMKLTFVNQNEVSELEGNIIFKFSDYNIDIIKEEDDLYLPITVLNQLFLADIYYDIYFNNDKIYGFEFSEFYGEDFDTIEKKAKLTTSSSNTEDIPQQLKEYQYNFLAFILDHFYGIKKTDNNSYKTFLSTYYAKLVNSTNDDHYNAMRQILADLDDLHISHLVDGYYNYTGAKDPTIRSRTTKFFNVFDELDPMYDDDGMYKVRYTKDAKTAVVPILEFELDTPATTKTYLDQVKSKTGVENVVFDLTLNTGGIVGTAWEIMGFMTNSSFLYYEYNPLSKTKSTIEIKSGYPHYNYKYYILTSPITFSSGNMLAGMAKDNNLAKIIGYKTGGGASSIIGLVMPTGGLYVISSNSVYTNSQFESTEYGFDPDIKYPGTNYLSLYDLNYLQSVVNSN